MTEVLDAFMKDECHIMLLVRQNDGDDVWKDYGSILRVRRDIYDGLLEWANHERGPPGWWEGKKNV